MVGSSTPLFDSNICMTNAEVTARKLHTHTLNSPIVPYIPYPHSSADKRRLGSVHVSMSFLDCPGVSSQPAPRHEPSVCQRTKETLDEVLQRDTDTCVDMHPLLSLLRSPASVQEAVDTILACAMQPKMQRACACLCHQAFSDLKEDAAAGFKRALLNTCQQRFTVLQQLDSEASPEPASHQKASALALVDLLRFIGLLYTKGLVSVSILQPILQAQLLDDTRSENGVVGACMLLLAAGRALQLADPSFMAECGRCLELLVGSIPSVLLSSSSMLVRSAQELIQSAPRGSRQLTDKAREELQARPLAAAAIKPNRAEPWRVAFTPHKGLSIEHTVTVEELMLGPEEGACMQRAFMSTFEPFEAAFIDWRLPPGAPLTLVVDQSDMGFGSKDKEGDWKPLPRCQTRQKWCCEHNKRVEWGTEWNDAEGVPEMRHEQLQEAERWCDGCNKDLEDHYLSCPICDFDLCEGCAADPSKSNHVTDVHVWCGCQDFREVVEVAAPLPKQRGIMHTKLWLLLFSSCLRVVISSFNLSERQQDNAGDTFWYADLPMKKPGSESQSSAQFSKDVQGLVGALLGDGDPWLQIIGQYDASQLDKNIRLIASVPGDYSEMNREYGLKRLDSILRELPPFPSSSLVEAQVWSVGGAGYYWYNQTFSSVVAQNPQATVAASMRLVLAHGGNNFDNKCNARSAFHRDESPLGLPHLAWGWHSKTMRRVYPMSEDSKSGAWRSSRANRSACHPKCKCSHGWLYFGSHNLSGASWGSSYGGNFTINNWELGVVIVSPPNSTNKDPCCDLDLSSVPLPFSPNSLEAFKNDESVRFRIQDNQLVRAIVCEPDRNNRSRGPPAVTAVVQPMSLRPHRGGPSQKLVVEVKRVLFDNAKLRFPPPIGAVLDLELLPGADASRSRLEAVWVRRVQSSCQ